MTKRRIKILPNWRRLVIEPDDQIVLQCPYMLTVEQTRQLREQVSKQFGFGQRQVIILSADMKIGAIRRSKRKRTRAK